MSSSSSSAGSFASLASDRDDPEEGGAISDPPTIPTDRSEGEGGGDMSRRTSPPRVAAMRSFLQQACAGVIMASHRIATERSSLPVEPDVYFNMLQAFTAQYLNQCWMSLMKQDDSFVTQSFENMGHRSPVCLIHCLFSLCCQILPQEPLLIASSNPDNANSEESMGLTRNIINAVVRDNIDSVFQNENALDALDHDCEGQSVAEARGEWVLNGRPEEGVFSLQ